MIVCLFIIFFIKKLKIINYINFFFFQSRFIDKFSDEYIIKIKIYLKRFKIIDEHIK